MNKSKTDLPNCARSRIKENIKVARRSGKHSVANDLSVFVYMSDTIHYFDSDNKSLEKIEA
jgi:hypothetical protein